MEGARSDAVEGLKKAGEKIGDVLTEIAKANQAGKEHADKVITDLQANKPAVPPTSPTNQA